jgi:hypothetical protein
MNLSFKNEEFFAKKSPQATPLLRFIDVMFLGHAMIGL